MLLEVTLQDRSLVESGAGRSNHRLHSFLSCRSLPWYLSYHSEVGETQAIQRRRYNLAIGSIDPASYLLFVFSPGCLRVEHLCPDHVDHLASIGEQELPRNSYEGYRCFMGKNSHFANVANMAADAATATTG